MLGHNQKLILVEAEEDYSGVEAMKSYDIESVEDLAKHLPYVLSQPLVVEAMLQNENFVRSLRANGWREYKKAKTLSEKIVLEQQHYIAGATGYGGVRPIDLDNLTEADATNIAEDKSVVLQELSKTAIRKNNPKVFKKIEAALKKARTAQAAAAKKRAEKKLEKARKALQEAGEL